MRKRRRRKETGTRIRTRSIVIRRKGRERKIGRRKKRILIR